MKILFEKEKNIFLIGRNFCQRKKFNKYSRTKRMNIFLEYTIHFVILEERGEMSHRMEHVGLTCLKNQQLSRGQNGKLAGIQFPLPRICRTAGPWSCPTKLFIPSRDTSTYSTLIEKIGENWTFKQYFLMGCTVVKDIFYYVNDTVHCMYSAVYDFHSTPSTNIHCLNFCQFLFKQCVE